MTTPLRPALAAAAALTAALALTTSAAAAPTVGEEPSLLALNWEQNTVVDQTVPGVTRTTWTEKKLDNRTRPRILQVVEIDPSTAPIGLESTVGAGDGVAETVAEQLAGAGTAARHPVAGVNGGLFKSEKKHPDHIVPTDAEPTTLQHMGVSVTDGVLHSSSCWGSGQGTSGAVIQYGVPYITKLRTELTLTAADGTLVPFDDINRDPGRARGCARDAQDRLVPEATSGQKGVYTDPDEIVLFTDDYKFPVPKPGLDPTVTTEDDPGFEVVLDSTDRVTAAREGRGGATPAAQVKVPSGGRILQGVGTGAAWLRAHAVAGTTVTVGQRLLDTRLGREIPLDPSVDVVSSFHQVLRDGDIPLELPDTCNQTGPGATAGTVICTDSRVALGTNVRGRPVLVTLTGQTQESNKTTHEDGAYLRTFAELLDSAELGLIDALNLDGGGSATLMTGARTHTPPTDRVNGVYEHRHVADTVYAGISGYGMYAK
ncbi:phosphodiester glycosidase family protein [Streptomyces sp. NPDC006553]|uniref:phosphodiester glycosidase family protein n=1 Tax=unclassified Streptomyces TaxID=2593676 RepID=UPI00224D50F9|nr:phosphodiester glycosidase family protein [Streptomyces sp. NBC_00233]MCX5227944.1 phosphodiester glycosidase family protein [Streptomyces sp. NBC_00233]